MSHLRLTILAVLSDACRRCLGGGRRRCHLYLQPLPSEAAGLTFTIASMSAVTASGAEHPLEVSLPTVDASRSGRQRLLASGRLPLGSYTGFRLTVAKAAAQGRARRGGAPRPGRAGSPRCPVGR